MSSSPPRWVPGVPMVAAALLFLPILWAGFIYDDVQLLVRNPFVTEWGNALRAFAMPFWDITDQAVNMTSFYRPLAASLFVVLHQLGGGDAWIYHLVSLLLHVAASGLVVRIALQLGLGQVVAMAAGLLFAIHGAHVEAVAWISALPDLMAAVFGLAAVLFVLRERWTLALLLLLAAMLSKESSYGVWLALIGITLVWGPRRLPRLAGLLGVGAAIYALRVWAFDSPLGGLDIRNTYHFLPPFTQTLLGLKLLAQHLAFLVWPFPHAPYHPLRVDQGAADFSLWGPALIGFLAAVAGLLGWLRFGARNQLMRFLPALLFAPLAPVLNTTLLGQFPFEERFSYLASGAACLLLAVALLGVHQRRGRGHLLAGMMVVLLAVQIGSTTTTVPKWRTEEVHYAWGKIASPHTMRPYLNEARLQLEQAQTLPLDDPNRLALAEAAFVNYQTALNINSSKWFVAQIDREQGNVGQGDAHFVMGEYKVAESIYRETLKGYPKAPYAHLGLAHCLTRRGEELGQQGDFAAARPLWEEGLSHYRAAVQLEPALWSGWHGVAVCLSFLGRQPDALTPAQEAFRRAPDQFEVVRTLAELQLTLGWPDRALATFEDYLQRVPAATKQAEIQSLLQFLRPLVEAMASFRAQPNDFGHAQTLAGMQEAAGMVPEALATWQQHLSAAPDGPFADRARREATRLQRLLQRGPAGG